MSAKPQFKYYLQSKKYFIDEKTDIWSLPIPLSIKKSQKSEGISITYGEYFYAVRSFLEKDEFKSSPKKYKKYVSIWKNMENFTIRQGLKPILMDQESFLY